MTIRPTVIVGAGVSGLAAARRLQDRGRPFDLLERCPSPGGLTRTIEAETFRFDYSGHFLHLTHFKSIEDIPYADLKKGDWRLVERKACCLVAGKTVRAPIQYNLSGLPKEELDRCVASYENRPALADGGSFRDMLVSGFGERLSDLFLIPQNEKTQSIPLDRLSGDALRRFFPVPDESRIRSGISGSPDSSGYNATFWYPANQGIEALIRGLKRGLTIRTNTEIADIDPDAHIAFSRDGRAFPYETVISSVPLKALCEMIRDRALNELGRDLSHGSTIVFNIGIEGALPENLSDSHWVYVPARGSCFYRVGCYSNISPAMAATGFHSLYVEVGVSPERLYASDIFGSLQQRVISEMENLFSLDRRQIRFCAAQPIPCAYAHLTPAREKALPEILSRLSRCGILPIGRYGLWDYCGIEDSMISGLKAASEVD